MRRSSHPFPLAAVAVPATVAVAVVLTAVLVARPDAGPAMAEPGPQATSSGPAGDPDPIGEPSTGTRPAPVPSRPLGGGAVTVAFAGDVHAEKHVGEALEAGEALLAGVRRPLADADLTVVNLETAVGTGGLPSAKQYNFLAHPVLLTTLRRAGVDVVSVANNHSLDYGWATLASGLRLAREAGLRAVGAGRDAAEAYAPAIFDVRGRTVAVLGVTRVLPYADWAADEDDPGLASGYDVRATAAAVQAAAERADHVVVMVHWGVEGADCPDENAVVLADALHAAGADAVVGAHPHVLQGVEHDEDGLTAYSLGNFLWYSSGPVSRHTGVLTVTFDDGGVAGWRFDPAIVEPTGHLRPADDAERAVVERRLSDRRRADPSCLPPSPPPLPSARPSAQPSAQPSEPAA